MMNEKTDCLDASEQSISHCLDASEQSIFSLPGRVQAINFSLPGRVQAVRCIIDKRDKSHSGQFQGGRGGVS